MADGHTADEFLQYSQDAHRAMNNLLRKIPKVDDILKDARWQALAGYPASLRERPPAGRAGRAAGRHKGRQGARSSAGRGHHRGDEKADRAIPAACPEEGHQRHGRHHPYEPRQIAPGAFRHRTAPCHCFRLFEPRIRPCRKARGATATSIALPS